MMPEIKKMADAAAYVLPSVRAGEHADAESVRDAFIEYQLDRELPGWRD